MNSNPLVETFPILLYNKEVKSFNTINLSKSGLNLLGKHVLLALARKLEDTERIYYYKLLLQFFENCIDKINKSFLEKYSIQLCKE